MLDEKRQRESPSPAWQAGLEQYNYM